MYIRKAKNFDPRNPRWECAVTVDGKRSSKTFDKKPDAMEWGLKQEKVGVFKGHTLHDALDEYVPVATAHRGSKAELSKIKVIKENMPNLPLDQVTDLVIIDYRDRRLKVVKNGTVKREMTILSCVFKHTRKELKWMAHNPCSEVTRPKSPVARKRGLKQVEIDHIINVLETKATITGKQLSCLFQLGIETGMRLSEMLGLTWGEVFEKRVHLPLTKNGSARDVPLSPRARELINSRRGIDPVRVFTMRQGSVSQAFCRYKHEGINFHDSRSEAIIRLSKKMDVLDLARTIGHDNLQSLMSYYNKGADELADLL